MVMSPDVERNIDMMTLSVELKTDDGSERQTERRWWLWTPKLRDDNGSEHQTENADGFECRDWEEIVALKSKWKILMALNAETKKWWRLWTSKLRSGDNFERRDWEEIVALNAKAEKWWWLWTLNGKCWCLWMLRLRSDDGSERWN